MKQVVHLAYLYSNEMNTYGDWGNVLCLIQRMKLRNIKVTLTEYRPGDQWPKNIDLIFMGGGQDSGQSLIAADFHKQGSNITAAVKDGVPALTICGAYQLFGHYFKTAKGDQIDGLGIFDLVTKAEPGRLIGNTVVKSPQFGTLIGFENHSGRTTLQGDSQSLGTVLQGGGNNGRDKSEGIVKGNCIGTYLHGPLLPKNPRVADWLIAAATQTSVKNLADLPDSYVSQARRLAIARPR